MVARSPVSSLLFLLLLPVVLAACGGEEAAPAGETPGATPAAKPVTIDFWHSETAANLETLERMVARYNASQGEVQVRPFYQGNDEELMAKLVVSLRSGQVPVIVALAEIDAQKMIDSGAVTPIQDFIDREDYDLSDLDAKAIAYYTVEDKLWAMPFTTAVPLLYYNKVTFREVGLDPERPPRDLEEVRQYAEKILKRDASELITRSGIAIDITGWYMDVTIAEHGDLFADNSNGRQGRATRVLFDNDTGRWFFQWWHDMVAEGLALNVGRNPSGAENYLAVATDRAAMTFGYAGALRSIVNALQTGELALEVGAGAVPGFRDGTGSSLLLGHGLWILNLRPQEEQEAAWKFVKWLLEPEQQAEWFAGSGCLPVSRSSVDLPAAQEVVAQYPLFQVALDEYLKAPANPASLGAILGPFPEVREAIEQGLEEILSGGKEPAQALKDAAEKANRAIKEYNERVRE